MTVQDVITEIEAGRLAGFRISGEWRTTEEAVLQFVSPTLRSTAQDIVPIIHPSTSLKAGISLKGVPTVEQIKFMGWSATAEFVFQWPKTKENKEEGAGLETYTEAYQLNIPVNGHNMPFVIGCCNRPAAGMTDRRRVIVFKGQVGQTLYPIVEFVGANDYAASGRMVSIIRANGKKTIPPGQPVPPEYEGMPLGVYDEIVVGPYAWHCRCVVAQSTDFAVMIRHAILRLNKIG